MITIDSDIRARMLALKKAMAEAENGKVLKREISKELRSLMRPLVAEQRTRVLRLPSKGGHGASMRQAIARQTRASTRWSGRNAGLQVIQRARSMPRNFNMAGRMFNRTEGWTPQTLGGEQTHQQTVPTKWFDEPTIGIRPEATHKMHEAMEATAAKIARTVH